MKSLFRVFLCLVLLLGIASAINLPAMADGNPDTTWQEDFSYTKSGGSILLSKYRGSATDLTVPATATIDGITYTVKLGDNCTEFFYYKTNLKTVTFAPGVDTSLVTNMYGMFDSCYSLTSVAGLSDTHNVTDMARMFRNCYNLTDIEGIGGWDTGKVTNTGRMFDYCNALTSLDLHSWDTSSVTTTSDMFVDCTSLTNLDLHGWDLRAATSLYGMFSGCRSLTAVNASGWRLGSPRMSKMFSGCSSLASLTSVAGIDGWDTSGVELM